MDKNFLDLIITTPEVFSLELSLDCGQAFRWNKTEDGYMCGVIGKSVYRIKQDCNSLFVNSNSHEDTQTLLSSYFDFDRDYKAITQGYSSDKYLKLACEEYNGIRILKQEPWETLCSFIISQNNNIPRIKGIVERLCENFGEKISDGFYTFPSSDTLSCCTVEDLAPLRAGFRARYIVDAAKKVSSGEVNFGKIAENNIEFGREELMKITGVGAKVAECALLYGFAKMEAFPVDVWVKRIMAEIYPDGLPEITSGTQGIAQQYLFQWRRNSKFFEK